MTKDSIFGVKKGGKNPFLYQKVDFSPSLFCEYIQIIFLFSLVLPLLADHRLATTRRKGGNEQNGRDRPASSGTGDRRKGGPQQHKPTAILCDTPFRFSRDFY